jgi:hypothetical protein
MTTRPTALPILPENIPAEMKACPHWVVWRYEYRSGQKKPWTKRPFDPRTGQAAKSTDPQTWATFDEALTAYQLGGWDGIGFVVHKGDEDADPFIVLDLDGCRDPGTGTVENWALRIVEALNTYTEISPSGTGLRLVASGKLSRVGRRKGRFEVYDTARYVTITGQRVDGTPATIEERQEPIVRVHTQVFGPKKSTGRKRFASAAFDLSDQQIIEKAKASKNGAKFSALFGGSLNGYPSHSEADQALCCLIAFHTKDPQRVDAIFRQSGLYREKWEREDYRRQTIARAIELVQETCQPRQRNSPTHNGQAQADQADDPTPEAQPLIGYGIILAYFRERYTPTHRSGINIVSATEGEIKRGDACFAPSMDLVERLKAATDAPRNQDGGLKTNAIPFFFRTWAPVAWTDLLAELKPEESAEEVSDTAQENFRRQVSQVLLSFATLGERYEAGHDRSTEVQKRPLIDWCKILAKIGVWGDIRGYRLWSMREAGQDGAKLRVAFRQTLFGQVPCGAELAKLGKRKFTELCLRYDVATNKQHDGSDLRIQGQRVLELLPDFLAELIGLPQSTEEPRTHAHARE